jgi:hypothetical protein
MNLAEVSTVFVSSTYYHQTSRLFRYKEHATEIGKSLLHRML